MAILFNVLRLLSPLLMFSPNAGNQGKVRIQTMEQLFTIINAEIIPEHVI